MASPSNLMLIQTVLSFLNLSILVLVLVMGATYGVRVQSQVKVYWDAADVSPMMVKHMVNQTNGIIDNVFAVSANMVPITEKTMNVVTNQTSVTGNVSFVQAATNALLGVGQADWKSVMGNASVAMGTVSTINYTTITDLMKQAQDPDTQTVVKEQIQHALKSFDFATLGASSMFDIFKKGIFKASEVDGNETM